MVKAASGPPWYPRVVADRPSYAPIFEALHDAGCRYLVAGGVAVLLHGYLRVTFDLDLIALKRAAGRPQDLLDVDKLEKLAGALDAGAEGDR